MTPAEFIAWRKSLGLSQRAAAEALGITRTPVQSYEAGRQDIPRLVELACFAIASGVTRYSGPAAA